MANVADEDKRKHLDFLQGTISRMASNSFVLKAWSVTLATGLIGLSAKDANPWIALLALLPIAVFCGLDTYYLALERRFRCLYNEAAANLLITDYSMAPRTLDWTALRSAAKSPAIWALHLPLAVVAGVVFGLLLRCGCH